MIMIPELYTRKSCRARSDRFNMIAGINIFLAYIFRFDPIENAICNLLIKSVIIAQAAFRKFKMDIQPDSFHKYLPLYF